jgi:hypothetical protein
MSFNFLLQAIYFGTPLMVGVQTGARGGVIGILIGVLLGLPLGLGCAWGLHVATKYMAKRLGSSETYSFRVELTYIFFYLATFLCMVAATVLEMLLVRTIVHQLAPGQR